MEGAAATDSAGMEGAAAPDTIAFFFLFRACNQDQ